MVTGSGGWCEPVSGMRISMCAGLIQSSKRVSCLPLMSIHSVVLIFSLPCI